MRRQGATGRRLAAVVAGLALAGSSLIGAGTAHAATPAPTLSILAGIVGTADVPRPGPASSSPLSLGFSSGVAVGKDGNVYIADSYNGMVERVDTAGQLTVIADDLNYPSAVAVDASNNVFIADFLNHRVVKVTRAGVESVFAGNGIEGAATTGAATASALGYPIGVAVDPRTGDVYIADAAASPGGSVIEKVTPAGQLSVVAGNGTQGIPKNGSSGSTIGNPSAVAVDGSGNLYIADSDHELVLKVAGAGMSILAGTGAQHTAVPGPATSSPLGSPSALAVDGSGNVYIADSFNFVVEKVTGSTLSIFAGTNGTAAAPSAGALSASRLNGPVGAAIDSAGNLYIADVGSNVIEKITINPVPPPVVPPPVTPPPVIPPPVTPPPPPATPPAVLPRPSVLISSGPVTVSAGALVALPSTAPSGAKAVAAAQTPSKQGTWTVTADGSVFTTGDAGFYGSLAGISLDRPIEGMAPTISGKGYWMVASDGGIFTFGDAGFYGSTGGIALNKPIVGMAATASGHGYWLLASDGGVFTFGDAGFYGSTGAVHLTKPINGMASTQSGHGYWMVASDGGIFTFGDAGFYGSLGATALPAPIQGMVTSDGGHGYWMVGNDGRVYNFGDAS